MTNDSTLYKALKDHTVVQKTVHKHLDSVNNWCAIEKMSLDPA